MKRLSFCSSYWPRGKVGSAEKRSSIGTESSDVAISPQILERHVSVIIPINSIHSYLAEALLSSLSNLSKVGGELLIILDGIPLEDWSFNFTNPPENVEIRVLQSDGHGIVAALNLGIKESRYQLIARMDSDDIMLPNRLELQVEKFQTVPDLVLLGGSITLITETGESIRSVKYPTGTILLKMLTQGCYFAHPTVMFRKSVVEAAGLYQELYPFAEDYDLWLRMLPYGKVDNLEEVLLFYRQHPMQTSIQKRALQDESTKRLLSQLQNRLPTNSLFSFNFHLVINQLSRSLATYPNGEKHYYRITRLLLKFATHPLLTLQRIFFFLKRRRS